MSWNKRFNSSIRRCKGVYLTGFFRIVYLHKYLKSYGFLFDLLTNSFIKRTPLRKNYPYKVPHFFAVIAFPAVVAWTRKG